MSSDGLGTQAGALHDIASRRYRAPLVNGIRKQHNRAVHQHKGKRRMTNISTSTNSTRACPLLFSFGIFLSLHLFGFRRLGWPITQPARSN
jgi:hypothetical protein